MRGAFDIIKLGQLSEIEEREKIFQVISYYIRFKDNLFSVCLSHFWKKDDQYIVSSLFLN